MISKNEFRPAYASASSSAADNTYRRVNADGMVYDAGETEDFNAFQASAGRHEGARRPAPQGRPSRGPQRRRKNNKNMIIAIAAAVGVLLLVGLIIGIVLGRSKHITYENNAYIAFADGSGTYHVFANGKEVKVDFEGTVEIVPSADNSFAYAVDNGPDGYHVYLLNGKKVTPLTDTPVNDIVAFAKLEPGFISKESSDFRLYTEEGDERIVKHDARPEKFMISADASTVVYTAIPNANDANAERRMYIYQNESAVPVKGCTPEGVSNYGDYVYATRTKDGQTDLYVITTKDAEAYQIEKSTGFAEIVETNVKGNEILFRTFDGSTSSSYVYRFKKNGKGTTYSLGDRRMSPAAADTDIAIYDSFKKVYMKAINDKGEDLGIYYLYKDYTWKRIAPNAEGNFTPNGDYYYFIHETDDGDSYLKRIVLKGEKFVTEKIYNGAVKLFVTKKNNVYFLDDNDDTMRFYNSSKDEKPAKLGLGEDIDAAYFHNYGNTIYYTLKGDEDNEQVYCSEEGSAREVCEFGDVKLTTIPYFSNPNTKKCYAYYYDEGEGSWLLFYTSNGSRFKLITNDCQFDELD